MGEVRTAQDKQNRAGLSGRGLLASGQETFLEDLEKDKALSSC